MTLFEDKKGIASLNLFVLLLFLFLMLLGFAFFYYNFTLEELNHKISSSELNNAGLSFRSFIVNTINHKDQEMVYDFPYESGFIYGSVNESVLTLNKEIGEKVLQRNFSLYQIKFCDNYDITPVVKSSFMFNGSCVEKLN